MSPIQKIIFGSPGTGKSYEARKIAEEELDIKYEQENRIIETVFHPEYTYSDFVGKLLPYTYGNSVVYKYYPGHFLKALGKAYKSLIDGRDDNYLLIIDELNRGNAAAIFGSMFQLLDRKDNGWSSYRIDISEMELIGLLQAMRYKVDILTDGSIQIDGSRLDKILETKEKELNNFNALEVVKNLKNHQISIPVNLSIIATINTSDESIYYLDTAFKRRWDWHYINMPNTDVSSSEVPKLVWYTKLSVTEDKQLEWCSCILGINRFIRNHHLTIRRIEDKEIGWWFIKPNSNNIIQLQTIKDKLMFYLWDNVFARDKKPLEHLVEKLSNKKIDLITFADFVKYTPQIMEYMEKLGDNEIIPF
ncbi:MAG TPA: AAA family ATPase [Leptolyngbyaceae cyanobacterium]